MDNAALFDHKAEDRRDQSGTADRRLKNETSEKVENAGASSVGGGNNRNGKRYQHSRTISKRKDNNQKQYNDALNMGLNSQELNKQLQANLPEDMRISKLLRRLCQENDPKACLDLCNKLGVVVLEPCNASYIRKSFDILADWIVSVLENGPRDCLDAAAEVFGMMGYVARNDFSSYRAWIVKYYKYSRKMKRAMMKALKKTVMLDVNGDLKDSASRLIDLLKDYLEAADADSFITITEVIVEVCTKYPKYFKAHFTDIVDIVVGWHLETDQVSEVKNHCSKVLQSFKVFWNEDLEFTLNLLGQFVEDIGVCCEDLESPEGASVDHFSSSAISFSSLLDAFNTVIKCLLLTPEVLLQSVGKEMVDNSFQLIVKVSSIITKQHCLEEVLLPINECMIILLMLEPCDVSVDNKSILIVIQAEIEIVKSLNQNQICSLLLLLLRYTEFKAGSISTEFLHLVWNSNSPLMNLRYNRSREIQEGLLKLYHRILAIKNVNTLQKAYTFILDDLTSAIDLIRDNETATESVLVKAQYAINFNLLTLSTLAIANNSILVMWTLQPSILIVLLEKLHLLDAGLWIKFQSLHFAILRVAYQHSIKNSNFISSSALLRSKNYAVVDSFHRLSLESTATSTASPTAEHFRLIIEFLEQILPSEYTLDHKELLLDWCQAVISQVAQYYDVLLDNGSFNAILINICDISMGFTEKLTLKCADCLELASSYKVLAAAVYQSIAEACCVHMCSTSVKIRETFSFILAKLPLRYTLKQVSQFSGNNEQRNQRIYELQSWYVATEKTGDLRSQYFLPFIERISFQRDAEAIDDFLKEVFLKSWFVDRGKNRKYAEMALTDLRCLIPWVQWEAAHFCVNNKLRTPIGKPQETFLKIESIIKEDARVLALKERSTVKDLCASMANQRHARILLGFLEALEKAIYNAAEGTAFALPNPEKPARTFFRVNSSTCAEWFNRIRTAVDLVALHCMEPEMVIRYSEAVLRELVLVNKLSDPIFEHTLMSLVWALLRNWESDALYGVYVWAKKITGKKYIWIKMAAEEAAGHRETAVEGFLSILSDPESVNLDRHIRDFIIDQITLSLIFTSSLPELYDFLISEETNGIQRATVPLITITSKQVLSWMEYEKTKDKNAIDMSDWESADFGTDIPNNFSCHKILCDTENSIASIFLERYSPEKEKKLRACNEVIHSALQECLLTRSKEYLFQLTIANHIAYIAKMNELTPENLKSIRVEKRYGSLTMMRVLAWSEFFDESRNCEQHNMEMRLDLVSVARKENNYRLCQRELEAFFRSSSFSKVFNAEITVDKVQKRLMDVTPDTQFWEERLSRAVYEQCKWLYCQPNRRLDAIQFASVAAIGIDDKLTELDPGASHSLRDREARFLLTIADWVQNEDIKILQTDPNSPLVRLVNLLPDIKPTPDPRMMSIFNAMDIVVGKLLQTSVQRCPELAKAWYQLGSWCYRWGKKMVEFNTDGNTVHRINLEEIRKILPTTSADELQKIAIILNQHEVGAEEEEIGLNETSSTDLLESLQTTVPDLCHCPPEKLQSIVEIWRRTHRTIYGYYEAAAAAYFRYLQLSSSIEMESDNGNSSTVTATLRLLRLIVKHALGLKEVLEEGLAATPTNPWRVITPQLFSRLNHHEPYVRKRVSELLCRVAKDAPHLIIFPAVVGSVQEKKMDLADVSIDEIENDAQFDLPHDSSGLAICFNALLDILSKDAPDTVKQVQVLVHELRRISLLWDELWVISLQQIYSEYTKRFTSFENELQKVSENGHLENKKSLFIEKHKLLLRPLVFVLEQLYEMTSRPSQTAHEKHFQDRYLKYINAMIEKLKEPLDFKKPTEGWIRFKALFAQMQQRSQKRIAFSLRLSEISPVLSKLSNTAISMPGIDSTQKQIFIRSVDNLVQILPTKTKPKKLMFYGSNGRRYSYLFKGLEDLHLDERIMQFLSIANLMMTKSIDCNGNITYYRAEHYSVIPLGPRSGLINWVDNTVPIFSLYKKWQQREALQKKDKPGVTSRPSELYYQKLTPLLQKHGLKTSDNRKDWPVQALKQVVKELQSETPRDLLAKELWCHSTTAAAWRQVVRNYSLSVAVMSVIGYIIGLGDRHLDNVLVKLASGEIVHIDYNVCFEKGKTLRVPERVPFRMTPNLEEALGITGIEGTFRLACEHVLKSLKKGRETLLTLLEAFVYDPLVDWAVSEDGGAAGFAVSTYGNRDGFHSELRHAKKQLEREVNRDTLAIRFSEVKAEWSHNRDDIYQQLLLMQTFLRELQTSRLELGLAEGQRDSLSRQIQVIREAESLDSAIGSHPLNTLSQRYSVYKRIIDEHDSMRKVLMSKVSECEKKMEDYRSFWKDYESCKLQEYITGVDVHVEECSNSEFDQVREFLESSNLRDTFVKTSGCRHELNDYTFRASLLVKHVLETLSQYGAIVSYYPSDFEQDHWNYNFAAWYRKLIDENSQQSCMEVMHHYQQYVTKNRQHSSSPQIVSFSYQLSNLISDNTFRLAELVNYHTQELNESTIPIDQLYEASLSTINAIAFGNPNGRQTLICAALKLCLDLNQNYLMLEQTASTAGDSLIDLQINDNWFLTELYMASAQLNTLSEILFKMDTSQIFGDSYSVSSNCLSACVSMYEYLYNMNECITQNFLTETMRGIISENQSIIEMISAVSSLQTDISSLPQLLEDLNMHLQCVVMNIPSAHTNALDAVQDLKRKVLQLGERYQLQEGQTEGAKLYLKLHSLFDELLNKHNELLQNVYDEMLTAYESDLFDQIKDSKDLAVLILNKSTNSVLEAIFVVKRVQAIIDFFTSCLQMACSFKGTGHVAPFNDSSLVRPIRKFISDFAYHSMLGIGPMATGIMIYGILQYMYPRNEQDIALLREMSCSDSLSLHELCNVNIEHTINEVNISELEFNQANSACLHLSFTCRKMMRVKLLSERIVAEQISMSRIQAMFVAHSWLHELSAIGCSANVSQEELTVYANRSTIAMHLRNFVENLTSTKMTIQKLRDEILTNTNAILHRLKWAAGANPDLVSLLKSFEQSSLQKRDFLDEQMLYLDIALKHCSSVLSHELVHLQKRQDLEQDHEFVDLVERFKKVCTKLHSCSTMVNKTEIALVELLDPEGQIDHIWLSNVKALIDDMTDQIQSKIARMEKEVQSAQENLHMSAHRLRSLVTAHHVLASDIRNLLKMKLKMESSPALREYLLNYKAFLETVSELHSNVMSKDFTDKLVRNAMEQVQNLLPSVHKIFDELFAFEQETEADDNGNMMAVNEESEKLSVEMIESPVKKYSSYGRTDKVQQNQKEQKRNAYAVSVWRRIRMKLEGRDPDPNRRCTAQEQVDWMIREAMDPDNLAVLYEGWTPWV
ncbi:serine/threonine-protein kinase Smg1 [Topomyia yanbarensis]|uniref:serine/threonine-protein kinase Smg1 n=1 Tax=Topomyia yanbarensis TaxID=2498891 RepID=UPI00273C8788|nr:serine/threonine-protein kinase Smg1 [Topomyia yanbarensis]XP_058811567.1 serine/threonine-protein kinase Smg1 [Topomyia yanbarensis]XP_058811575.1 serine/threonine-protein kinase Smg1 [Topomyia yanbarensis]